MIYYKQCGDAKTQRIWSMVMWCVTGRLHLMSATQGGALGRMVRYAVRWYVDKTHVQWRTL